MKDDIVQKAVEEFEDREILRKFVVQSWGIEGYNLKNDSEEIEKMVDKHEELFTNLDKAKSEGKPTLMYLCDFTKNMKHVERGGALRDTAGMDVRVGNHIAPKGGPEIKTRLIDLLSEMMKSDGTQKEVYDLHHRFESLHPFMDGNGRSGRALAFWMANNKNIFDDTYSFLHFWYYQSLKEKR